MEVADGEMLILLGPSGCGKSTILRCLAGLEEPTTGVIKLGGEVVFDDSTKLNLPPDKRDIGLVFQTYVLRPHMTVRKNVEFPLRARKSVPANEIDQVVDDILKIVRCDHLADRYPGELSGGQQQRIALARALSAEPSVVFLDEPLSNLDALLRIELRSQLKSLHRRLGFTAIYVTHDQTEALSLGDRIAVLEDGEIVQLDTPQIVYERPTNSSIAAFMGVRNSLGLKVSPNDLLVNDVRLGDAAALAWVPQNAQQVRFRASSVVMGERASEFTGADGLWLNDVTLRDALYVGYESEAIFDFHGSEIVADVPIAIPLEEGATYSIFVRKEDCLFYDNDEQLI